jgi:hypothetical protein
MAVVVTRSQAFAGRSNQTQLFSLLRTVSGAGLALLAGISAWLFARRMTGALVEPLSPMLLLATGAGAIGFAALLRFAWFSATKRARQTADRARSIALALPMISLVLLAGALSLPESSTWAVVGLWGMVVAGECGVWFVAYRRTRTRRDGSHETESRRGSWLARWTRGRRERVRQVSSQSPERHTARDDDSCDEELLAPDVSHKLARRRTIAGNEIVEGLWRVPFAPGERATSVHITFCPPLAAEPKVTVNQLDGPAASVKVGQVQTFGLRLDVRLSSAALQATELVLHVESATTVAAAAPAH